jgi:hexosaminidase
MKYQIALTLLSLMTANALAANQAPALIPLPQRMESREGTFRLTPRTQILVDRASQDTGEYLADRLCKATGYNFDMIVSTAPRTPAGALMLTTRDAKPSLGSEGYELIVASDSVVVCASGQAGMFYGVQTLLQLLPPEVFASKPVRGQAWTIPCVEIEDQPRFKWRGLLFDVARHFFTK